MKTETVLTCIFLVGLFLKCLHVPGSSILIILSLSFLGLLYMFFSFYFLSDVNIKTQNLTLSVFTGMAIGTIVVAILFRLMHWPGALPLMIIGLISTVPTLIASIVLSAKNRKQELDNYYKRIKIRQIIVLSAGLICLLLPLVEMVLR